MHLATKYTDLHIGQISLKLKNKTIKIKCILNEVVISSKFKAKNFPNILTLLLDVKEIEDKGEETLKIKISEEKLKKCQKDIAKNFINWNNNVISYKTYKTNKEEYHAYKKYIEEQGMDIFGPIEYKLYEKLKGDTKFDK